MSTLIDQTVRYDLAESTSPALTLGNIVDVMKLRDLALGYGTSRGDASLRAMIAADSGVDAGHVLVTAGSIEAMYLIAQTVCRPGDGVLLATPCFPPARTVPDALGAAVDAVALSFDDGYRLPLDRIAAALTPRTRLVSLASPQNPSGVRFTDAELAALLDKVQERAPEAIVLVDETYRESTYGDAAIPQSVAALSPRIVTCSSLSKAHGAPGLRVGWLTTTDDALNERLRQAKFHTAIASSTVDEHLAMELLRRRTEILRSRALRLREALDELMTWVRGHPVEIVQPDGGALCCLRLPADRTVDFYRRLEDLDTRVAPGSWFGEDERIFRLGFGHLSPSDFTAALDRLGAALGGPA
jgi:aspartate/methionine/tyrosine aminotransferase